MQTINVNSVRIQCELTTHFQTERGEFPDIEVIGRPHAIANEMHRSVIPNKPSSAVTHTQSYKHRHAQLAMIKHEIFPYNPDVADLIVGIV